MIQSGAALGAFERTEYCYQNCLVSDCSSEGACAVEHESCVCLETPSWIS